MKANQKSKATREALLKQIVLLRQKSGDNSIPVVANGELVKFDVPPVIKQGCMLIPVRAVTNALGADVKWDQKTNIVTITKVVKDTTGTKTIIIIIDLIKGKIFKDNVEIILDVPAQLINSRTIHLRFMFPKSLPDAH